MEVAQKVVDKCATEGFNEDQAKAISKAMKDYNNNLIRTQERLLANKQTKTKDDSASGKYFGIEVHVPNEVRKSTNEYASTDIATNNDLINKLRDSIKSLDINDKDSVYKYKAQYEEIMRPVYTTQYPLQRNSDIDDIISKDVNEILEFYSNQDKNNNLYQADYCMHLRFS